MGVVLSLLCLSLGSAFLTVLIYARNLRFKSVDLRESLFRELGTTASTSSGTKKKFVGFFHPYCNAGGGGERVLWAAIASIQRDEPDVISVVYTGDVDATKQTIIDKVQARFAIALQPSSLHFVFLHSRSLVEDSAWPRFTLLGQSLGSMYLVWEAMSKFIPDLFIDTMGYAFTFHVVSWLGSIPVGAYVHYPTISTNMLARVQSRQQGVTNSSAISSSVVLSQGKLWYYRLFMYYYALSLRRASFIMVNSSWTKNHIDAILQHSDTLLDLLHQIPPFVAIRLITAGSPSPKSARVVHPSCDTREMSRFALEGRERVILSVAQFRPEKDHAAQLHAFSHLVKAHPEYADTGTQGARLVLLGGSRNEGDAARVDSLKRLAKELHIEDHVQFVVNASYPEMLNWLSRASIGLSTMVDEHFGINVVEFMAAGVIPVTHASGGPLNDIVVPFKGEPTGYHATSPSTFADALHTVLTLSPSEERRMRERARTWAVEQFSEEEFVKGWNASGWRKWLPN
ncbi:glycosyltransferase family 4 protein [Leucogyrophana mollusca]|uniref:Glycosyltransferase family 4 protein n=1 Tax=Leucogyrophana mollusca TaxID=85980 RepID=A0ACB8BTP7_9AGAM|nr:glycosyltransferase family 4 protein [Leucogyrophana mollusca]